MNKVIAYIPIILPSKFEADYNLIIDKKINELLSDKEIIFFPLFEINYPINFEIMENDVVNKRIESINYSKVRFTILKISTTIKLPLETVDENIELTEIIYSDELNKRITDFIIALNISSVGSIQTLKGLILINGKETQHTEIMVSDLRLVSILSKENKWPELEDISIFKVWEWLLVKKGFIDGVGGNRVERALTALTFLFGKPGGELVDMNIIYTMIAIESLYATSTIGIKEQIISKVQVFLGNIEINKKLFKSMYDTRSKIVHGGMNFPGKYYFKDADIEFEKYYNEVSNSTLMAQAILLATFQKMIKLNLEKLEFQYILNENTQV